MKSLTRLNRRIHHWASIVVAVPLCIVLVTGVLLILKKDIEWIQPSTISGESVGVSLGFDEVLAIAQSVPEAGIKSWSDVDRLDVRPNKGMLKLRAENRWEIQIDANTGAILQTAYRRSELIESIHDGSFFGEYSKHWVFLPAALVLICLWLTGMIIFLQPHVLRARLRRRRSRISPASKPERQA